jgi:hypothetical protein
MHVLHNADLPSLERLGLFNDTTFVVREVQPFFDGAREDAWEVWGMTGSEEIAQHIQSYFLVTETAGACAHLLGFFHRNNMDHVVSPTYTKQDLVEEFEVGLSQHMLQRFELQAWFCMADVLGVVPPRKRLSGLLDVAPNPTVFYWDVLLRLGCPLVKKLRWGMVGGQDVIESLTACEPQHARILQTVPIDTVDAKAFR